MKTPSIYSLLSSQARPERALRASDKLETQLVRMIISLELPPGAMINEAEIKTRLKCGRTPLREALQRLAQENLIVSIPRTGMFVAELDLMSYVKLIEAAGLLESFSAYLAVDQCSHDEIDDLEENISNSREAYKKGDLLQVAELDFEFHRCIAEFTRNDYVVDATTRLHRLISRYIYIALKNGLDISTSTDEHLRIVKAFRRRVPEEVKNLMYLHTLEARDRIAATLLNAGRPVFPTQTKVNGATQAQNNTIRIGVPAMMTGPGAPMCVDIIAGISMAVERANAEGGLLGKKLEIVYADIKDANPEDSRMAAELLINAGVVVFIPGGFFDPQCALQFTKYKQPMFHASAIKKAVDAVAKNINISDNVFQMCSSEENLGYYAFMHMVSISYAYPNKKVALLGSEISYDMLVQQGVVRVAQQNSWEIVLNDSYPFGSTRFDSQLARIRAEKPAIIFGCIASTESAVEFVRQFLQNPTNSLIFLHWSPVASQFIYSLGEKANGILWQTEFGYLPTKDNMIWAKSFKSEFGREPGMAWPAMMEDMLRVWMKAVEYAGNPTDYAKVIEYIRDLNKHPYEGRSGRFGINPDRNEGLSGANWLPVHFYQIQNQQNVLLFLDKVPFKGNESVSAGQFTIPYWLNNGSY